MAKIIVYKGGSGSGNFGHTGRPGQVGGSSIGSAKHALTTSIHGWNKNGDTYSHTEYVGNRKIDVTIQQRGAGYYPKVGAQNGKGVLRFSDAVNWANSELNRMEDEDALLAKLGL